MNGSVRVTFGNTATQKPTLSLITRGNCCWPRHGKQLIADCLDGWLDAGRFAVSKAINDLRAPRGWRPSPKWWTVLAFHPPPPSANEQGSSLWLHESWWTREQSDFLKRKRRTHIELFSLPSPRPRLSMHLLRLGGSQGNRGEKAVWIIISHSGERTESTAAAARWPMIPLSFHTSSSSSSSFQ